MTETSFEERSGLVHARCVTSPWDEGTKKRTDLLRPPGLAVGEVLALAAAPGRVWVEGAGTDGLSHGTNELRRPGEIGERPARRIPLEARNPRLQEHVQPKLRDRTMSE